MIQQPQAQPNKPSLGWLNCPRRARARRSTELKGEVLSFTGKSFGCQHSGAAAWTRVTHRPGRAQATSRTQPRDAWQEGGHQPWQRGTGRVRRVRPAAHKSSHPPRGGPSPPRERVSGFLALPKQRVPPHLYVPFPGRPPNTVIALLLLFQMGRRNGGRPPLQVPSASSQKSPALLAGLPGASTPVGGWGGLKPG